MAEDSRRRGLSALIATIILIGITVVASLVLYSMFTGFFGSYSQNIQCLATVDLIRPGGSASYAVVTVTVKNTGSVPIKSISVQYVPEGQTNPSGLTLTWDPSISDSNPLPPGGSASATATITSNLPVAGKVYPFIIKITGTAGQTYTTVIGVTCRS